MLMDMGDKAVSGERVAVFSPVRQRTTPDTVADVLRTAILDGSLAPGSPLREAHIAADLGISRAPLREALRKLEEEGLVSKVAFRGAFVAEVGEQAVEEIASLRRVLEPFAIERGLKYLRGEGRERLESAMADLTAAARRGDVPGTIDAHLGLHRLLYEAADHKILLDMWSGWQSQLRLFLAVDIKSFENPAAVARAHAELVDVILNGSVKTVRDSIQHHVHGTDYIGKSAAKPAKRPPARATR